MLMTVEPGIYIDGFGGVRIEDLTVVTEEGHENLAHSPKELIEIPVR
jgi:Xaa-Pro aminopeptidase